MLREPVRDLEAMSHGANPLPWEEHLIAVVGTLISLTVVSVHRGSCGGAQVGWRSNVKRRTP